MRVDDVGRQHTMDRPLTDTEYRRNRLRRALKIVLPLTAGAVVLTLLPGWVRPTLERTRIRTAHVESGALEAVITASGTVVPEIERALSSPVDAKLLRLLKRPG